MKLNKTYCCCKSANKFQQYIPQRNVHVKRPSRILNIPMRIFLLFFVLICAVIPLGLGLYTQFFRYGDNNNDHKITNNEYTMAKKNDNEFKAVAEGWNLDNLMEKHHGLLIFHL